MFNIKKKELETTLLPPESKEYDKKPANLNEINMTLRKSWVTKMDHEWEHKKGQKIYLRILETFY